MDQEIIDIINKHFIGINIYTRPIKALARKIPLSNFYMPGTRTIKFQFQLIFSSKFFIRNPYTITIDESDLRIQVLMAQKLQEYKNKELQEYKNRKA